MPKTEQKKTTPKPGDPAPAFALKSTSGDTVRLSGFKGAKCVVLYFYPKDDTPGCTKEACGFRDDIAQFKKHGAVVLGVSTDDEASHRKFTDKYGLPFPLLCDTDSAVAKKYGAWGEKNLYGRKYHGILRSTFLIDPQGKIAAAWPRVKVEGHVQDVLEALRQIGGK